MGIALRGPGIYVPPHVLTNQDLVELVDEEGKKVIDTSNDWIVERTGIRERRISIDENVRQLGIKAVDNLKEVLGEDLKDVGEIILATNRHRDGEFPSYASSIASHLGLENVIIHDELAGCPGMVYALRNAFNSIQAGEINSALVGGVERLSDFTNYADRSTCPLFGDGAGWYKLERREDEEGIIANFLGGTPDRGDESWSKGYLTIVNSPGKKLVLKDGKFKAKNAIDDFLIMEGQKVYKFATRVMRKAVHGVLERSKYELSDVDVLIPHGANIRIVNAAEEGLRDKGFKGIVFTNLHKYGNTSTASTLLAAAEAREKGVIIEGSLVVQVSFGAGFTYGANLFRAGKR